MGNKIPLSQPDQYHGGLNAKDNLYNVDNVGFATCNFTTQPNLQVAPFTLSNNATVTIEQSRSCHARIRSLARLHP